MPGQGPVTGSNRFFSLGVSIAAGSVIQLTHGLGVTPFVGWTQINQNVAQGSNAAGGLVLVSRTITFIGLLNPGVTTVVADVQCDGVWSGSQ